MKRHDWPDYIDTIPCGCLVWKSKKEGIGISLCSSHRNLYGVPFFKRMAQIPSIELAKIVVTLEQQCLATELHLIVWKRLGIDLDEYIEDGGEENI